MDTPALPAATLVLMRERPQGPPELLMVERAAAMAFAGGAMVFPGGRVDPGDAVVAADPTRARGGDDPEDAAARVAAIRETIEEVGIAVGFAPEKGALSRIRAGLAAGEPFAGLLADGDFRLDLTALVPFARWLPPQAEGPRKRFDTRFYAALAPGGAAAEADGGESVRALWATAERTIAEADAGHRHVIFPTRRNLERLATYASFAALEQAMAGVAIGTVTPWVEERGGEPWLCIPEGWGYPVTAERLEDALRG